MSRDAINELGGICLYAMCGNHPVLNYDMLGFDWNLAGHWDIEWVKYVDWRATFRPLIGAARVGVGCCEVAAGVTFGTVTSETVVGGLIGAAVATHGVDVIWSGLQMCAGKDARTCTSQLMESAFGVEPSTADTIDDLLSGATTLGFGVINNAVKLERGVTIVTRWGRPGLECGDWVVEGRATYWGYFRSGKWQPGFGNKFTLPGEYQEFTVSPGSLHLPTPEDDWLWWMKIIFGQKIYDGTLGVPEMP